MTQNAERRKIDFIILRNLFLFDSPLFSLSPLIQNNFGFLRAGQGAPNLIFSKMLEKLRCFGFL